MIYLVNAGCRNIRAEDTVRSLIEVGNCCIIYVTDLVSQGRIRHPVTQTWDASQVCVRAYFIV